MVRGWVEILFLLLFLLFWGRLTFGLNFQIWLLYFSAWQTSKLFQKWPNIKKSSRVSEFFWFSEFFQFSEHFRFSKYFRFSDFLDFQIFQIFRLSDFHNLTKFQNYLVFRSLSEVFSFAYFLFPSISLDAQDYFGCGW